MLSSFAAHEGFIQGRKMSYLSSQLESIPPITKTLLLSSVALTLLPLFGLLDTSILIVYPEAVLKKFQIWRLLTCFFFYGRPSFSWLFQMVFLYRQSRSLEETVFENQTASYLWMILLGMIGMMTVNLYFMFPILGPALVLYVIYYWSRKNADTIVTFMFGIKFPAVYLPWVLVIFDLVMSGSLPILYLVGIAVGHTYFFLADVLPLTHRVNLIRTPSLLYKMYPTEAYRAAQRAQSRGQAAGNFYQWGGGQRLGGT
mmetsp:Transcript_14256/g.36461  ORF Transcript_14256/g.36461 Transcript_14256/m.36461 type:complete len:257 (+) Transcript_14256:1-771(+)